MLRQNIFFKASHEVICVRRYHTRTHCGTPIIMQENIIVQDKPNSFYQEVLLFNWYFRFHTYQTIGVFEVGIYRCNLYYGFSYIGLQAVLSLLVRTLLRMAPSGLFIY